MLDERERDGVTVDVCRRCRGMWLDRGELEKLIARASQEAEQYERGPRRHDHDDDSPPRGYSATGEPRPYRKKRWFESFGDIFD